MKKISIKSLGKSCEKFERKFVIFYENNFEKKLVKKLWKICKKICNFLWKKSRKKVCEKDVKISWQVVKKL